MKRKVITAVLAGLVACQPAAAFAYTAESYDVSVPEQFRVTYENSADGYFEDGLVTGFGSAVTFKGYNEAGEMEFYAVTDRGPNADAPKYSADGTESDAKIFPCPDFTPSIAVLTLRDGEAIVTSSVEIKDSDGNNITGLPLEPGQVGSTNETALDMEMKNIGYDSDGLDTEGIAVDKDGNFWLCDEYGPFIVKVSPDGNILEKYMPGDGLPEILADRIANRGFEGLTITPSGKVIASVQSVLDVNGETSKTACFTRIVELDPDTGNVKMYAYPVDVSQYSSPKNCKIGDIYAVDDDTMLVIEQGKLSDKSMSNVIYKVELAGATDITDVTYQGKAPEYAPSAAELNITFVSKSELIDLRAEGWTAEKAEGICMTDSDTIAVINDNDFGIATKVSDSENEGADITDYVYDSAAGTYTLNGKAASPEIEIVENTEPAQLWLFNDVNINETEKDTNDSTVVSAKDNYVMIRNAAAKMSGTDDAFGVSYDTASKSVILTRNEEYTALGIENAYSVINSVSAAASGWKLTVDGNVSGISLYNINGYNYVKVSELENLLGCSLGY